MTRPSPTPTGRPTTRGGLAAVVAAVALALVAGLFLAPVGAQSEDDAPAGPRRLTDEQRQCLEDQGLERPGADGEAPTPEQRDAFRETLRAAADECGIELPVRRPLLTDEQRQCLEDQGLERPTDGERPTDDQRQAFRDAADECGIELPAPGAGRPGRHWARGLTDEQRDCLRDQGLERPADGERPTGDERDARRQAFRDAADECGIELPTRPALPDDGSGTGTTTD